MTGNNPEVLYLTVIHLDAKDTIYHNILNFKDA